MHTGSQQVQRHVIVGLGNPGREYAGNRHNVGFRCVGYLAERWGAQVRTRRFRALFGEAQVHGHRVLLVMPQTFMNDSGLAVAPLCGWFKVPPSRVLVIYDDLDLPLARLRLRPGGSSGGHRGIQSLINTLGTSEFPRLRVGIGRPTHGDPIDYVLNDFDRDQEPIARQIYPWVEEITLCYLDQGVHEAMNSYNGRDLVTVEDVR